MYFRVSFETKPLHINPNERIEIEANLHSTMVTVKVERIEDVDLKIKQEVGSVRFTAQMEQALPPEEELEAERPKLEGDRATGRMIDRVEALLRETVERTVYIYRWRRGLSDAHNPIVYRFGTFYSKDGLEWRPVHGANKVTTRIVFGLPILQISPEFEVALKKEVDQEHNEPLGHELFNEAWVLRQSHPRSALIVGLASLEAGFKEMVADLVPGAGWLVENAPTPPMRAMLKNYMPTLPARAKMYGLAPQLTTKVLNVVQEGVELRNKVAHGVRKPIKEFDIDFFLRTIRCILYVFDVYRGWLWAAQFIEGGVLETPGAKKISKK